MRIDQIAGNRPQVTALRYSLIGQEKMLDQAFL